MYMEIENELQNEIVNFIGDGEARYTEIQDHFSKYTKGQVAGALNILRKKNILSTKERGLYSKNVSVVQALKHDIEKKLKKYDLNIIVMEQPNEVEPFVKLYREINNLINE